MTAEGKKITTYKDIYEKQRELLRNGQKIVYGFDGNKVFFAEKGESGKDKITSENLEFRSSTFKRVVIVNVPSIKYEDFDSFVCETMMKAVSNDELLDIVLVSIAIRLKEKIFDIFRKEQRNNLDLTDIFSREYYNSDRVITPKEIQENLLQLAFNVIAENEKEIVIEFNG